MPPQSSNAKKNTAISQVPVQCVTSSCVALPWLLSISASLASSPRLNVHALPRVLSVVSYMHGGLLEVAQPIDTLDVQVKVGFVVLPTNYFCADSA